MKRLWWFTFLLLGCATSALGAKPDMLIADFEGKTYGNWTATGEAFGPGPARGTLPKQHKVSGFEGKGLVNTYYQGDKTTGTLTSPPFTIERPFLNFLIGGGDHRGKTCLNLLIDRKVVRTATGFDSECLERESWDVRDLVGKTAVLEIVDRATGGWGHINVDQISQSERNRSEKATLSRELTIDRPYLYLPIKKDARKRLMRFVVDGQKVREFVIELAEGKPDFWAYDDVMEFDGKKVRVEVDRMSPDSRALEALRLADQLPGGETLYHESLRPQFHFTPARGWTNDPNGMVYYDGEYHLFFQHNPVSTRWGNMTWGHAVSPDMVHWKQLPEAIYPDKLGTIFSGSAVVDHNNTAGFQTGQEKPIVCIYTSAGGTSDWSKDQPFTQSIAYSNDRGRTWTKYEGNPVLGHIRASNRDPKVFWHEPSRQWIMPLFLDVHDYTFYGSKDLKSWTFLSNLDETPTRECPDFFELALDGDKTNTRWVFWGGDGTYFIGSFDGKTFHKEAGPFSVVPKPGLNDYAAQTFSDIPAADGRRIQIAWMHGGQFPGMPFNQQMTVPRELTLRTTPEGIRLFIEPVEEIKTLRGKAYAFENVKLAPGENLLKNLPDGELFDIDCQIEPGGATTVGFDIRGHKVEYSPAEKKLRAFGKTAALKLLDGRIKLRILVDRRTVEIFANGGRVSMASNFAPKPENKKLAIFATGATATIDSLDVWEMKSIWNEP